MTERTIIAITDPNFAIVAAIDLESFQGRDGIYPFTVQIPTGQPGRFYTSAGWAIRIKHVDENGRATQ